MGSVSAQVRSIANRNDYYNVPAVPSEVPAYITKEDAREAQRVESMYYGGQIPSYSTAANMQVSPGRWDLMGRRGSYY
jgi:hypothetical protein